MPPPNYLLTTKINYVNGSVIITRAHKYVSKIALYKINNANW